MTSNNAVNFEKQLHGLHVSSVCDLVVLQEDPCSRLFPNKKSHCRGTLSQHWHPSKNWIQIFRFIQHT